MKLNTFKLTLITIISAILAYLFFTMSDRLAYGQELTTMINGTTFTITKESEFNRRLREGDRVYKVIDGQVVPIKKIKAKDFIPTGEILPIQTEEDLDGDGNTDFVIIRTDTNIRIGKEIKPKDTVLVEDTYYEE